MAYKKVVFNAGNPLDVNELNQLSANITESIDAATSSLISTIDTKTGDIVNKITKVTCGVATVIGMKDNKWGTIPVNVSTSSFLKSPIVTVTVAEDIGSADIDIYVLPESANTFTIRAKSSNKATDKLKVNWIAASMEDVKTT